MEKMEKVRGRNDLDQVGISTSFAEQGLRVEMFEPLRFSCSLAAFFLRHFFDGHEQPTKHQLSGLSGLNVTSQLELVGLGGFGSTIFAKDI